MKALPTKVGAQPKQIKILAGLVVVFLVVYFMNRTPSSPDAAPSTPRPIVIPPAARPGGPRDLPSMPTPLDRGPARGGSRSSEDFRPSLKLKEGADVSRIDPTLKLDLLAKLRNVSMEGGSRSIFEFSQPPPPPPPKVAAIKPGTPGAPGGPPLPKPPAPIGGEAAVKPPAPPATPIPLKFYGYSNTPRNGPKRAFFLDGEDIFVAGENEMIRNRYKIIKIGINSAVVEDTTNKNQQTLPLIEELAG
jgi:hypothetical protein